MPSDTFRYRDGEGLLLHCHRIGTSWSWELEDGLESEWLSKSFLANITCVFQVSWTYPLSSFICQKKLTADIPSQSQHQSRKTKERGESGVDSSKSVQNEVIVARTDMTLWNHVTNPFFLVGFSEHNNPRKKQQHAIGTTRLWGKFGVRGRPESGGITSNYFQFAINFLEVRKGLMSRRRAILDFRLQKRSNLISDT